MEHDSTAAAYDLIYLVSCSANNMAPDLQRCQTMNCPALFQMARRHLLTVTAAFALEQAVPLPSYFIEEKYKAIRRLSLYEAERDGIFAALDKHAIWHMPLKGIVLQKDYPQPEMREMSDNDILIDASKADKIKEIMEAAGYTCLQFQKSNHDIYKKGKLLEFEMHRALFDDSCQQPIAAFGKALQSRMVQDDENAFGCHLREDDFYLYLICKIYCDYQGAGTGLRALLDVYLYNRSGKNRLNRKYIAGELQKLQLDAFEQNVRLLAEKLFSLQPLSEEEQMEVRYFIESDCHGTPENLLAKHQYILQIPLDAMDEDHKLKSAFSMMEFARGVETENETAEKVSFYTLRTPADGKYKSEDIMLYGMEPDSRYVRGVPEPLGGFGAGDLVKWLKQWLFKG